MIMSDNPAPAVLHRQMHVEVPSNLAGEILIIKKDQDVRLFFEVERIFDKTFIISNIFDASMHLMGCVDGVRTI